MDWLKLIQWSVGYQSVLSQSTFQKNIRDIGCPKKGGERRKAHLDLEALNSLKMNFNFSYSFQPRGASEERLLSLKSWNVNQWGRVSRITSPSRKVSHQILLMLNGLDYFTFHLLFYIFFFLSVCLSVWYVWYVVFNAAVKFNKLINTNFKFNLLKSLYQHENLYFNLFLHYKLAWYLTVRKSFEYQSV